MSNNQFKVDPNLVQHHLDKLRDIEQQKQLQTPTQQVENQQQTSKQDEQNPHSLQSQLEQLKKQQMMQQHSQQQQEYRPVYQVPVELVTLPSKGQIYPFGHPLSNEESVEILCMTARI